MIVVKVKYYGPTNSRGAKIKATSDIGSVSIPYPYDLSDDDLARAPLIALLDKYPDIKKDGWILGAIGHTDYWINPD